MPLGMLFWLIMVLWFIFGFYVNRDGLKTGVYGGIGGHLLVFVLFFIVGWPSSNNPHPQPP